MDNKTAIRSRVKRTTVESSIKTNDNIKPVTPATTTRETAKVEGVGGFVTVEGGITKNLGDYNSARIGVTVCLPCGPTVKDAEEAYKAVSTLVDKLMNEEYDKVMTAQ
jgi:hypothetical protein